MKKLLVYILLLSSRFVYSQPISMNPDGTIVVDGTGKIVRTLTKVFCFSSTQSGATVTNGGVGYRVRTGGNVWIRFGGNATIKLTANNTDQTATSNFRTINDTNKRHPVLIWGDLDSMTRFTLGTSGCNWKVDIKKLGQMFPNMQNISISSGTGVLSSSDLADLPKSLVTLSLSGVSDWNNKRVHGSINDLDTNITSLTLTTTGDSIWGNTDLLSRRMTILSIRYNSNGLPSQYHVSGQYKNLPPNLVTLFMWEIGGSWQGSFIIDSTARRFYGRYIDLPRSITSLTLMNNFGSSTGNYTDLPPNLTTFASHMDIRKDDTANHFNLIDLPRSLTSIAIQYFNITSGAKRKMYGTLADLPPNLVSLTLRDVDSMVTGNIEGLPATLTSISLPSASNYNFGSNKITYGGGVVPAWNNTTITIQTCMTSTAVDNFLIDWSTRVTTNTARTITLSKIRTSASDVAVDHLTNITTHSKTIVTSSTNCP